MGKFASYLLEQEPATNKGTIKFGGRFFTLSYVTNWERGLDGGKKLSDEMTKRADTLEKDTAKTNIKGKVIPDSVVSAHGNLVGLIQFIPDDYRATKTTSINEFLNTMKDLGYLIK